MCLLATCLLATGARADDAGPVHPLDALNAGELNRLVEILKADGKFGAAARVHSADLIEPAKADVRAWKPGTPFARRARVELSEGGKVHEAEIDLVAGKVVSWTDAKGEPAILFEEFLGATDKALADKRMVDGLAKRGLKPEQVFCLPLTAGNFGTPAEAGKRLMNVPCYVKPSGSNFYAKPVEGLFATIDLKTSEVVDVTDTNTLPVPGDPWGYTPEEVEKRLGALRPETRPARLAQEGGPNLTLADGLVRWDIWRFHVRADKRPGVVLSLVDANDGKAWRSVAYQMNLSEVFVPYMDPDKGWYWRTYMDSGEYGFGIFLTPLRKGVDCPAYARFMAVTMPQDSGAPMDIPDAICIFERNVGDPAWRHFEVFAQSPDKPVPAEGRPATELVVRSASEVGNYDYLIDYVFQQDGTIRVQVGATGLDAVKGAEAKSMKDPTAAQETRYGTLIAPNLVAPYHSHYFNFRLDLDVDGEKNDFMRLKLSREKTPEGLPRRSLFTVTHDMPKTEMEARSRIDFNAPALWHFSNHGAEGPLGHDPGYMLMPGGSFANPLLEASDPPVKRNPYIRYQLWVTPYDESERFAGGKHAVMSDGRDTLETWTSKDRPIGNRDIVAWYTLGFHHVTRTEDWPVMPTHWFSFSLMPHNFFPMNPALSIRGEP
jgi:primary-amine oxidase